VRTSIPLVTFSVYLKTPNRDRHPRRTLHLIQSTAGIQSKGCATAAKAVAMEAAWWLAIKDDVGWLPLKLSREPEGEHYAPARQLPGGVRTAGGCLFLGMRPASK
jgi:hypothetical protein